MKGRRAPASRRSFPLTCSFNFFAQSYSGAGRQILEWTHGRQYRHFFNFYQAALLPPVVVRMTEIILAIIKLLLAALRALSIIFYKRLLWQDATRPWPPRPSVARRCSFDNHPPSAWAAP